MPDVYGRESSPFGGAMTADATRVIIGAQEVGLIATSVSLAYAQQARRVFDLRNNNSYYVFGRTQGQGQLGQLAGFGPLLSAFLRKFGDGCRLGENNITLKFQAGCGGEIRTDDLNFTLQQVFVPQFQLAGQSESAEIRSEISLQFANLVSN